jgi:hypothetical protein
MVAFVETP